MEREGESLEEHMIGTCNAQHAHLTYESQAEEHMIGICSAYHAHLTFEADYTHRHPEVEAHSPAVPKEADQHATATSSPASAMQIPQAAPVPPLPRDLPNLPEDDLASVPEAANLTRVPADPVPARSEASENKDSFELDDDAEDSVAIDASPQLLASLPVRPASQVDRPFLSSPEQVKKLFEEKLGTFFKIASVKGPGLDDTDTTQKPADTIPPKVSLTKSLRGLDRPKRAAVKGKKASKQARADARAQRRAERHQENAQPPPAWS